MTRTIEGTPGVSSGHAPPLAGVRVLDLLCSERGAIGRLLAELGADVVRLEPAGGAADRREGRMAGAISIDFATANMGKRFATSDRFNDLAADADILLIDEGADSDGATLRAANPALVILSLSDFGVDSRQAHWRGSDAVFHALSGQLSRSGLPGREPLLPPAQLALSCAAIQACYVALLAHYRAVTSGTGDWLRFAMFDGAVQALDPPFGTAGSALAGATMAMGPRGRPDFQNYYPIVPCRDGFVRLCILAPRQWQAMYAWMGSPEAFADARFANLQVRLDSPDIVPAIARFFADKTRHELEQAGQKVGVPIAALLDLPEALASEQMVARRVFRDVTLAPGVTVPLPDGMIEIDGQRMGPRIRELPLPDPRIDWRERDPRTRAASSAKRPLDGVRVLDFGVIVVGAESGRLLADQGADVIKVEHSEYPDGGRNNRFGGLISPNFVTGHRNKRSLGLNVRDPRGRALLLDLVRQTDVLLANFKGGVLQSLGLDYETLSMVNPRLILVDSSAFGPNGPWSRRMGYGPLVRASSGLTMQWCYPGESDGFGDGITAFPDHVCARIGAIGVLALLLRRLRSGVGGLVTVSQAEVMLNCLAPQIAADAVRRTGGVVTEGLPHSAMYACVGDDEWCVVTLAGDADGEKIDRITGGVSLDAWCGKMTAIDAMEALQAGGIAAGAMLRAAQMNAFDYFAANRLLRDITHPHLGNTLRGEAAPVRAERLPDPPQEPAPLMGEQTLQIVRERLAVDDDEVRALVRDGVLEIAPEPVA